MARKKTREELEREIAHLQAAEEGLYALQTAVKGAGYWGPGVLVLSSGDGESYRKIEVVGIDRAAGGVVIATDGQTCSPVYLSDWCMRVTGYAAGDPYERDIANKARRTQAEAARARWTRRPHVANDERSREDHVRDLIGPAYQDLVAAKAYVMGPEVREHTNKARAALAWTLRVHLGVKVESFDDPSGRDGAPKEMST